MSPVSIELFTDPACPFAFSAEPVRQRLRWHYGDGLRWTVRMIVLTRGEGEAGKLAQGAPGLQRRYGMPIDPVPYARTASSEPACRAVVAARLHAPEQAEALLRRLRVRVMTGGLLDDPELIDGAAHEAGLDPSALSRWVASDEVAIAHAGPELPRRPRAGSVDEVLDWAPGPLATAEVALIMQADIEATREALAPVGRFEPAGADGYWTLPARH